MFLRILQNAQENTCVGVSFSVKLALQGFIEYKAARQVFSNKFYEIFKNTSFHRTPPVAATECWIFQIIFVFVHVYRVHSNFLFKYNK